MDPRNPPDQVDRVALELMDSFADCYCNPKLNIQTLDWRTVRGEGPKSVPGSLNLPLNISQFLSVGKLYCESRIFSHLGLDVLLGCLKLKYFLIYYFNTTEYNNIILSKY